MRAAEPMTAPRATIRQITREAPWQWLEAGWRDLWRHPAISLGYGCGVALGSYAITFALIYIDALALVLPLAAGFMLLGPMVAVGLYEVSRRLEAGETVTVRAVVLVAARSPLQLGFMGVVLALFMLAWVRAATLLFAVFYGLADFPPLDLWMHDLFFTWRGLAFLCLGTAVGGILALTAYAMSVISVPLLLARDCDVATAIAASVDAVRRNLAPMLLWGWLIAMLTALGIVTMFVGLIVTFPLVGHATWHAYRALVADS